MKANELMIGDFVLYNDDICIVDEIRVDNMAVLTALNTDVTSIDGDQVSVDEITPIPLTAEILAKNGFVVNKHVYPYPYYEYINDEDKLKVGFAFPQGNRTSYKEPWVYIDSENVFIEHLPCVFVHQLQHALRLCNIEKEIIV